MSTWSNAVVTTQGVTLLSKLVSGDALTITKAQSGSGTVAVSSLQSQTAVTSVKQTLALRTVSYPASGTAALPVYLTNSGLSTGYTATQIGVFAQDPDVGEILFFIAQADSGDGLAIPSAVDMQGFTAEWTFNFAFGNASSVNATINPANTVSYSEAQTIADQAAQSATSALNSQLTARINNITVTTLGALPLTGGNMTGNIGYQSPTRTGQMIKFLPGDNNGSGIAIGDGGTTIVGGGESAALWIPEGNGASTEAMIISNDTDIKFYVNCQNGTGAALLISFNRDGSITAPGGFTGTQEAITSGTAAPSGGSNGDIYIQY